MRSLSKLRDPDAFDAWVHRITVRHGLRRRGGVRGAETPLALSSEDAHPAAPEGPDRDMMLAECQVLTVALAELPPKGRPPRPS